MKRRMFPMFAKLAAVFLLFGNLAGCTHAQGGLWAQDEPPIEALRNSVPADSVEGLLGYGAWLRSARPEELEQEYVRAEAALESEATAANRLRLALLLSLPGVPFQDYARAREFFDQITDEPEADARPYQDAAHFMRAMLDERKRTENLLAEERRQRQALEQKLEQLKAIEQDTGTRIPPKPMKENQRMGPDERSEAE